MINWMYGFRLRAFFSKFSSCSCRIKKCISSFSASDSLLSHWLNELTCFFHSAWSSWRHNQKTIASSVYSRFFIGWLRSFGNDVKKIVSLEKSRHGSLAPYRILIRHFARKMQQSLPAVTLFDVFNVIIQRLSTGRADVSKVAYFIDWQSVDFAILCREGAIRVGILGSQLKNILQVWWIGICHWRPRCVNENVARFNVQVNQTFNRDKLSRESFQ